MTSTRKVFSKRNIPNILLVSRMILVPVIVALLIADFFTKGDSFNKIIYSMVLPFDRDFDYTKVSLFFLIAGSLFVLASITDWLDGFLARKYNWVSDFGKFWDPIADKVLINSVLICFAAAEYVPFYIPVIMIARDVIVDAQRMVAAKKDIVVAANYWGKLKTVLQMVGIIVIFFFFNAQYDELHSSKWVFYVIQNLMLHLATIMSIASGINYFVNIRKAVKNHGRKS